MKENPFHLQMDGDQYVQRLEKLLEAGFGMREARKDLNKLERMRFHPIIGAAAEEIEKELDKTPAEAISSNWLEGFKGK